MRIAHFQKHLGEEPFISGTAGSGTIFFAGCNLHCVFCQNYQISQKTNPEDKFERYKDYSTEELAEIMLDLQAQGAHNINLVSPSHLGTQIIPALRQAKAKGLKIPIVYNSNGYDPVDLLKKYDGLVDIYLPDMKYGNNESAQKYSQAPNYVKINQAAIKEMFRQVGNLTFPDNDSENQVALRGLAVRHLILPNQIADSFKVLDFIASISKDIFVCLMSQYYPTYKASQFSELDRPLKPLEYEWVINYAEQIGLENILGQELESQKTYRPDFSQHQPFNQSGG